LPARITDEDDAIAANTDIGAPRFFAGAIDEFTVKDEEI